MIKYPLPINPTEYVPGEDEGLEYEEADDTRDDPILPFDKWNDRRRELFP